GRPSMEVINEFANVTRISKDAGARFNSVLSWISFNDSGALIDLPLLDSFTNRYMFAPKNPSVEYSLMCANNTSTNFTREWSIRTPYYNVFESSKDYWNILCLSTDVLLPAPIPIEKEPKVYKMRECEMVYNSLIARFFILSDN